MIKEPNDAPAQKGKNGGFGANPINQNEPPGLAGPSREGREFRFSGAGGITPCDRSWTGADGRKEDDPPGGIGSRLIAKLLEQRAEVLSRYEVVLQRKAEYEAKLEQIDRELADARRLLGEILNLNLEE